MENAKEDLVWPLERYPSGRFRTHRDICQYPIGKQDGRDVFCGGDAEQEVEGYLFCSPHSPMAERGCLDIEYTDGTTPQGIIAFSRWLSLNGVCEADPRLIFCNT